MVEAPLGKTQGCTLETHPEIETPREEDIGHTPETNPEGGMNKKEIKTQEGKEDMMIGVVILAMGVDVEDAARRPCVMGGPL